MLKMCVWVERLSLFVEKPLVFQLSFTKTLAVGEREREVKRWKVNGEVNRRSVM